MEIFDVRDLSFGWMWLVIGAWIQLKSKEVDSGGRWMENFVVNLTIYVATIKRKAFSLWFFNFFNFFKDNFLLVWLMVIVWEKKTPGKDKIVLKTELRILCLLQHRTFSVVKFVESGIFPYKTCHTVSCAVRTAWRHCFSSSFKSRTSG